MSYILEPTFLAFREELQKTADWRQRALGAAGGAGLGAITGAGLGAVHGAYKAHQKGESLTSGALKGGKQGLGVGVLAGGALGGAVPSAAHTIAKSNNIAGSAVRSGMRQLHAVSGLTPQGGLGVLRGGAYDAKQALQAASTPQQISHASRALKASEDAERMGLTNLPGYLGAIKEHGLGKVLKTDAASQWHSGGIGHKALSIGLPAAGLIGDMHAKETEGGPGKGEMIGKGLAGAAGGMLGSAMPLSGQLLFGGVLSHAGGLVGRGIDKMRKRPPPSLGQVASTEQHGQHTPVERVMSPAALGQPPEGMMA